VTGESAEQQKLHGEFPEVVLGVQKSRGTALLYYILGDTLIAGMVRLYSSAEDF
jgi:hypothetical protein